MAERKIVGEGRTKVDPWVDAYVGALLAAGRRYGRSLTYNMKLTSFVVTRADPKADEQLRNAMVSKNGLQADT
jgi:hypothetical protein